MTQEDRKLLSRIDLNLLVVLDLLLKERHVSRVADKMFVSQSAISRSLKKLRELFKDPLFTRTSKGLMPTYRALQIEKDLDELLSRLSFLINSPEFIASDCDDTFSISVPPFLGSVLIPKLYIYLQSKAPRVGIIEVTTKSNTLQLLDNNQLDFAFHYESAKSSKYHSYYIGNVYPVLYVRNGHPLLSQDKPSLSKILSYPLIGNLIEDDTNQSIRMPITEVLQDFAGQYQKPTLRTTQTGNILNAVKETDSVLFGSNGLNMLPEFDEDIVEIHSMRGISKYVVPIHLLVHERNRNSDAHKWLLEIIQSMTYNIIL